MSSPNEPGEASAPATTGAAGAAAPGDRPVPGSHPATTPGPRLSDAAAARAIEPPESAPRQRAAGHGQESVPQPPVETKRFQPRPSATGATPATGFSPAVGGSSGPTAASSAPPAATPTGTVDARVSRYVTGTAAPAALKPARHAGPEPEPAAARTDITRPADYASELPDLSGPLPRPAQQRRAEAPTAPASATRAGGRLQVGPLSKSGPMRASMQIRRVDPWSALKVSLLLSVAMFFAWMIAVAFLYLVLGGMGVWSKLNSNVGDLLTNNSGGGELVSAGSIFGGALMIGLVNIVLLTAMATIGAFVYNLSTDIVGGVEVTLADRD